MKKIAIYGTGKTASYYFDHHDFSQEEIVCFIENKKSKDSFMGKPVISVADSLSGIDEIHMANSYLETLVALLGNGGG